MNATDYVGDSSLFSLLPDIQWSEHQWIVSSWTIRSSGVLSLIGSSAIIYMIISDRENKLSKPNHRLMLAMSIIDSLSSTALATSTWAFPRELSIYGSIGSMTTCKIQYFFTTLGLAVPMYNASLCLLYLLTIRHRWHINTFGAKIEPFLHAGSVLIPLVLATVPTILNQVRIPTSFPICCVFWPDNAWTLIIMVSFPILSFCVCCYSMASISIYVNMQSKKMRRYSYGTIQLKRESERKATIRQAVLYTAAFTMTYAFVLLSFFVKKYPVQVLESTFYPLQGFWNFLLYIRPNVMKMKEANPDRCLLGIICTVVLSSRKSAEVLRRRPRNCIKRSPNLSKLVKEINLNNDLNDDLNSREEEDSEEAKHEILAGSPNFGGGQSSLMPITGDRSIKEKSSPSEYISCDGSIHSQDTNQAEGASQLSESGNSDAGMFEDSDIRDEACVVRRASLAFATAIDLDDISLDCSYSQESDTHFPV